MTIKLERLTKTYNPDSDFPVHAVQHVDLEIKTRRICRHHGAFWLG